MKMRYLWRFYKRSLIAIALYMLMLTLLPFNAAAEATVYHVAVSTTSVLNVREEPSTTSEVVTTLARGAIVTATGEQKGLWVEVQTDIENVTRYMDGTIITNDPYKGWVKLSMLSLEEPYTDTPGTITGNGRVRMRNDPGGSHQRWLTPNTPVSVLSVVEFDGSLWYRVRHDKDRGWIKAEYLEIQ